MSRNELSGTSILVESLKPALQPVRGSKSAPWIWASVAGVLLASSAAVRAMQDRRHQVESSYTETCPFPLKAIPNTLGGWKIKPGGDMSLDALTMRITGGTDHILRTYVDELTGVSLVVLVLFGPAEPVLPHTPEVCYPACGYAQTDDPSDRMIASEAYQPARYRSCVYAKSGGRAMLREEVYYSFRLDGAWAPDIGSGRKFPRRNPSVFKVQVQRRVAEGERRDRDDPIEQFLSLLIPAIEQGIASGTSDKAKAAPVLTPSEDRTSMGGVRSPTTGRESLAIFQPTNPSGLESGRRRPSSQVTGDLAKPTRQVREAANHANGQQNRRQVDSQYDLNGDGRGVAMTAVEAVSVSTIAERIRPVRVNEHVRHPWYPSNRDEPTVKMQMKS